MKFTKIYLEGDEDFIREILETAKGHLGLKVNVINLDPKLEDEE